MEVSVVKSKKEIKLYLDGYSRVINETFCYILGNIYNLDKLAPSGITNEEKLIEAYKIYKNKLFKKLDGEFAIILIFNGNITCVRDRMGSKQIYYMLKDDTTVISTSLGFFIKNYKEMLNIDRQVLSNYLCYSYIQAPNTIFKEVSKLESGSFVQFKNSTVLIKKYYNLVNEYLKSKDKLHGKKSFAAMEDSLKKAVLKRVKNKNKIGIFFSAGIDSTLLASLSHELTDKEIHAYTIGFYDEERNEAVRAKKIAEYIGINYHEFYIDDIAAKEIIHQLPFIYSEPFADPSMIPTVFLNQNVDKVDVILTGDGADQLFCGSSVYDTVYERNIFALLQKEFLEIIHRRKKYKQAKDSILKVYNGKKDMALKFVDIEPNSYYDLALVPLKAQIKYMLFDIKTFLANRLFSKVSFPAGYYNLNITHPFVDNEFVDKTLKLSHKYKYNYKVKKYILKKILYKRIPEELLNQKKCGFGIPLKEWLYNIYREDIILLSNEEFIKKQNLFNFNKVNNIIQKLNNNSLNHKEAYTLFAYYMFQLWYKAYIEN